MKKNNFLIVILLLAAFLFSGCVPLFIGGAAVGASTGTYYWINNELKTDYNAPFDKVWTACEKTVADMRGIEVVPVKEIAQGKIATIINDEKVQLDIRYKSKNLTTVSIRVGIIGNKLSSQLLHDKISDHLARN
ncbi:MAG: hypothetical protein CVU52_10345 [Deltaproteobacteria bacterium HGW-Deltaproteobacteria-10]|nr:MAG: hypothetical protein CVU52_10345 [Deltaproteobacteria bacterium HGW-Deltaproteobacteria-10]